MNTPNEIPEFTKREKEVMHLLMEGASNKMIAIDLGISPHTANMHKRIIKAKTNTNNIAGKVAYGFTHLHRFKIEKHKL